MASKAKVTKTQNTYDLRLEHSDIRSMMNDPDVLIDAGNVSETQPFAVILKKANGQETLLKDLNPTDTLVFRFSKVITTTEDDAFDYIDVINNINP